MKSFYLLAATLAAAFFSTTAFAADPIPTAVWEESRKADPKLFDAFYLAPDNGGVIAADLAGAGVKPLWMLDNEMLVLEDGAKTTGYDEMYALLGNYASSVGSDALSKRYIAFAKSRGNRVSLYKPSIAVKVRISTQRGYPEGATVPWTMAERCMVEFDQNGEVVSMFARFHNFDPSVTIGVSKPVITEIIMGKPTANRFQNDVSLRELEDAEIRRF